MWEAVGKRWQHAVRSAHDVRDPGTEMKSVRWWDRRQLSGTIAITGSRGAGKSVLRDALLNRIGHYYVPPDKSLDAEKSRAVLARSRIKRRLGVVVVPGQESRERTRALDQMFDAKLGRSPIGLIHVVCWGHNDPQGASERRAALEEIVAGGKTVDLEAVLDYNRYAELADFREVCDKVREVWARHPSMWLIIAVAQTHLYWNRIDEASKYYVPREDAGADPDDESAFRKALRDLVEDMRKPEQSRVAILPVASYPQEYRFAARLPPVRPVLTPAESRNLMGTFNATLGEFCAG
ncbi:hypothetical protein [Actinoplanes subtropicus]|uniref:hypothetical protein n=1 Tax=Actinoplanes subtropicus TaxID=543632 RepID=UPI00068A27DC|nr:hypothetical protein [Actinoplanes subtropicus]